MTKMRLTADYSTTGPSHGGLPSSLLGASQDQPRNRRHSSAPASQRYVHGGHGDHMNGSMGSHQNSHQHPTMIQVLEDPNDTATAAAIAVQQLQASLGADLDDDEDNASICDYFSSSPPRSASPGYGNNTYGQQQHGPNYGNSNNAFGQHAPCGIQKPASMYPPHNYNNSNNNANVSASSAVPMSSPQQQLLQQQQGQQQDQQQARSQQHQPKAKKDKKSWTQLFSGLNLSSELHRGVSADSFVNASSVLYPRSSLSSSNHSTKTRNLQACPPHEQQQAQNLSSSSRSTTRRRVSAVAIRTAAAGAVADLLSQPEEIKGGAQQGTTSSTDPPPLHPHESYPTRRRGSGAHARGHRRTQRRHSYHPGSASQNTNDNLRLSHAEFLRMKEELRNSCVLTNAGVKQVMARRSSIEHKRANTAAAHSEEQQRLQNLPEKNQTQDSQNADKKNRFFQKGKEALLETGMNGFNALQNVLVKTLEDELAVKDELYDKDPMHMLVGDNYSNQGGSRHRRSITSTTSSLSNTNTNQNNNSTHSRRRLSSRRVSYHSQYSGSMMDDDVSCLLATHGALSTYEHDSLNSGAGFFMTGYNDDNDDGHDTTKPQSSTTMSSRTTATTASCSTDHPQYPTYNVTHSTTEEDTKSPYTNHAQQKSSSSQQHQKFLIYNVPSDMTIITRRTTAAPSTPLRQHEQHAN